MHGACATVIFSRVVHFFKGTAHVRLARRGFSGFSGGETILSLLAVCFYAGELSNLIQQTGWVARAVLAMAEGFEAVLKQTGSDDTVIVMRGGAQTEINSVLATV